MSNVQNGPFTLVFTLITQEYLTYILSIQIYHKRDVIDNLDMKFHDSVTILVSHNNMKSIELLDPLHPVNYSKKFGPCSGCT